MKLSSLPKRPVTRVRVNDLPNVLSGRRSIPTARPFQPPPGFPGTAAAAADPWSALVESVGPRRTNRRARSQGSALLVSTAAAVFVGLALTAWSLSRSAPPPTIQPLTVAALPQAAPAIPVAPAPAAVEAREDSARPEPLRNTPMATGLLAEPAPAMPEAVVAAAPVAPAPPPPLPVAAARELLVADKPVACAQCAKGGSYGTSLEFADSPTEAAKQAAKQNKLMFVVHISGNFEDDKFT